MKSPNSVTKRRGSSIKSTNANNNKSKSTAKTQKNQSETRVKKSFPLPPQPENHKEINFVYDFGKLELVDYKNNITECDIFGSPKKKFLDKITGIKSFSDRLNKKLIKKIK